jgi:predicted transcriptional regulator
VTAEVWTMLNKNNDPKKEDGYMDKMKVRELMVPTDRFPKISDNASLFDALSALEKAQEAFLSGKAEQRIMLVEDEKNQIIGKISPIDLFKGLEKNYNKVNVEETLDKFGLKYIWTAMRKDYNLWESPFKDLCRKAGDVHVKDFVNIPGEGQTIDVEDSLSKSFHLFVVNRHDTLFVMEKNQFVGLLRFSDVYSQVSQTMKECTF